jgi:3-dehydroquinate synthase
LIERAGTTLEESFGSRKVFLLSDTNVWKLWGNKLARSFKPRPPAAILISPGERYKRLVTVEKITDMLAARKAERSSLLVVLGGGVVGDMGAFAASVYLRGIDYVQVPTTLLAQVDSAIGGKTGVNLAVGKNLVGTFYQPRMVLTDPQVLKTLPPRQLRAGLFEALKCAVIGDAALFEYLEAERERILACDTEPLSAVIRASSAFKSKIVSSDEKESGLRRVLNFGHTTGHALEAATKYRRFLHGEAVAWGMLAATRLAAAHGRLSEQDADRISRLIVSYGPVPSLEGVEPASLTSHLAVDKKVREGKLHFVLPRSVGEVEITADITPREVIGMVRQLAKQNPFSDRRRAPRPITP